MRSWQLDDQAVSWILIAAMIAPFVIASHAYIGAYPLLTTPILAGVAVWAIARGHVQRRRLWMTLAMMVAAFWPALYVTGWLVGILSGNVESS